MTTSLATSFTFTGAKNEGCPLSTGVDATDAGTTMVFGAGISFTVTVGNDAVKRTCSATIVFTTAAASFTTSVTLGRGAPNVEDGTFRAVLTG